MPLGGFSEAEPPSFARPLFRQLMPVGFRPAGILFGRSVPTTTSNNPVPQQKEPPLMNQNCTLPIRDPRIEVVYRPIDLLRPDPRNARRHSGKQIRQIADSIRAF